MHLRSATLRILLALFLLFTQQMGLAHVLSHLDAPSTQSSQDQHIPGGENCDQCLAFAGTGTGIAPPPVIFSLGQFGDVAISSVAEPAFSPASHRPFEARAPPSVL